MTEVLKNVDAYLADPTAVSDGEFKKSRATKQTILEAMTQLLAEQGFAACSTPAIARAAGLSRTAMLYHFPTRRVLLEAVVVHITRRRVEMHEEMLAELPRDDRFRDGAVEAGWAQVQTPEFKAFCELSMAARTDAELDQVFRSSLEAFDRARRDAALYLAEPEVAASPVFDLRRDIHRLVLEGLAKQDGIAFDVERRSDELFAFLKLLWSDQGEKFLAKVLDRS